VRVKVDIESDATKEELAELLEHANYWSPVANTFRNPVDMEVSLA
jgi:organic hydroperoxide reductase OsmC/OhrA